MESEAKGLRKVAVARISMISGEMSISVRSSMRMEAEASKKDMTIRMMSKQMNSMKIMMMIRMTMMTMERKSPFPNLQRKEHSLLLWKYQIRTMIRNLNREKLPI